MHFRIAEMSSSDSTVFWLSLYIYIYTYKLFANVPFEKIIIYDLASVKYQETFQGWYLEFFNFL